ncbi:hypothetical protein [Antarcticirhabdus aurantiaca]|uniref:hypothetical protein n=1 Tax=Antarcticirhabdus aurantiaca TaxID=2606717 RepID=UPI003BB5BDD8
MVDLGHADTLRQADAGLAAEDVGEEAAGRDVDGLAGAEELDAHDGGGARENNDEADPGEEVDLPAGRVADRRSRPGANEDHEGRADK